MSFRRDDGNLLKKYKPIWIKIDDLKDIELNALPVKELIFHGLPWAQISRFCL